MLIDGGLSIITILILQKLGTAASTRFECKTLQCWIPHGEETQL